MTDFVATLASTTTYQARRAVSVPLLLAENIRPPQRAASTGSPGEYQSEHSERQVSGSVGVSPGARWMGSLSVAKGGDQSLLLIMQRDGPLPAEAPLVDEVALVIPPGEAHAVVTLLQGLVEHAKQAGIMLIE
jgi:hypothetical protein